MAREHTDEDAAAPGIERGRRWGAQARRLGVLAGLCVKLTDHSARLDCEETALTGHAGAAIVVCREEYERTKDPRTGAYLANALRRAGSLDKAAEVADALLSTPASADALYVLGKIATKRDNLEEAERALRDAAELHQEQRRWGDLANDLLALGEIATERARFVDALRSLDRCISAAKEGRVPKREGYCRVGAARVLRTIGYWNGAKRELDRAEPYMTGPSDRAALELERGNLYQMQAEDGQATHHFQIALANAERASLGPTARSAHLNLGASFAELGRVDEAARHVRQAEILDRDNLALADRRAVEALIAFRRGDLARAAQLAEDSWARTDRASHDKRYEIEALRAEVALRRGELAAAATWARRAVEDVEQLRSKQPPLQVRTWVQAQRWAPYELLFASLARAGDARGALVAFERWQGRALLDRVADSRSGDVDEGLPDAGHGPADPPELEQLQELEALISSLQTSALARPAPDSQILEAVGSSSLLALVVADGQLWRITADEGRLEVSLVGPLAALRHALDLFRTRPGDARVAALLGDLLVPPSLARSSDRVLHVILDEHEPSVTQLPAAGLQVGGRLLVAARPIVRAVRPSDMGCVRRLAKRPTVTAIADAAGNLPGARREAEELAVRLYAQVRLGPYATRTALFQAVGNDLIHVAVHSKEDELGGGLELHDGRVSALEIAGQERSPARVVLAACHSGVAEMGTPSLAAAFLAAGASQVIATLRTIDDAAAARLTRELYSSDISDLPRALAQLQAKGTEEEWLKFAVFGRETCNATP